MPNKILKRTSFGLIRTNPRLTTNIKIVADSSNKIYLESIDADPLLSKSIYKGFKVSYNGSYSYDLRRFYSQNGSLLPKDIAYSVFEEDSSIEIKSRYHDQYDFTYGCGFYPKNSKLYPEEFAIFAPIWLERDNLPDHFVIFRMDGPVTINPNESIPGYPNGYTGDLDNASYLEDLIQNSSRFFENYIQKAKIIKSFDLTEKSPLGTYLRNHVNDPKFPESSLYASLDKNAITYWNGISYDNGGFTSKGREIYKDYTLVDKTITESDDKITTGFRDSSIVCANLLNMEFLFDDQDQEKYKFSRYFGLYMSEVELGKFILDRNRLYADKDAEFSQSPMPKSAIYGDAESVESRVQFNPRGIKVYPKVGPTGASGITGPYSGRLLTFSELQNPRFGYVKDKDNNLYSIDNVTDWATINQLTGPTGNYPVIDSDYLRLKTTHVDWKTFTGYNNPFDYISAISTDKLGVPSIAFKVIDLPSNGDEIRVRYTDWNNPSEAPYIDTHTVRATNTLPAGQSNGLLFSTNGTLKNITDAISSAINNIALYSGEYQVFSSIVIGDEVIIFSRIASENWNKLKISLFSGAAIFPFDISNQFENVTLTNSYLPSPISLSTPVLGNFVQSSFYGGNNNPKARAIVERDKILEFQIGNTANPVYVKTNKGYQTIRGYGIYLDEPIKTKSGEITGFKNVDKYYVVDLKNNSENFELGSSNKIALYTLAKNSCGYLSVLPIRDFDFDFENTEYNRSADSNVSKLYDWYKGQTGPNGYVAPFDYSTLSLASALLIDEIVGPTSPFVINGEFQRLIGYTDELTDEIDLVSNEYGRLKETTLAEIALSSRVVPYINKWVYDNECVDVRENGYRLNTNGTFGYSNFSPSFDEISRNTKFFTHEWYYLQKYPPYMTFEEKVDSFSYFDEDIHFPLIPNPSSPGASLIYAGLTGGTGTNANLLSTEEDYFLSYFTRETIDGLPIKRDFKYSLFSIGDSNRPAETLFRGSKVEIKDRSEFSPINYNKESLRYIYNEKYNGYKFSALLSYGDSGTQITCIKNDKFKSISLVIQSDLKDILTQYVGPTGATGNFIDRALLYSLNDKLGISGTNLVISDVSLSGLINNWTDQGTYFEVSLTQDIFGNFPNLIQEVTQNENGSYNSISVTDSTYTYTFQGIFSIETGVFRCISISGFDGFIIPTTITPNGTLNYSAVFGAYFPSSAIYENPFNFNPIYIGGGYGAYQSILDSISFSSISSSINLGDPEIKYINVTSNGSIEFDTYTIDISRPDYPVSANYLKREVLEKTSSDLQENAQILGYRLTALDRLSLSQVSRYRGTYNPKWKNVINFVDTTDLKLEGLDYLNIQILSDLGYYQDTNLAKISALYFNKVNVENPNVILTNRNVKFGDSERFIYPLIGEIAIDFDSFFLFKSNWDVNYYKKYLKRALRIPVIGTREPKEEKSFFGSKAISIPNNVRLETFPTGVITGEDLSLAGSINNTDSNLVSRQVDKIRSTELTIDVFVTKSLQDWLISDGFAQEFYKYINPNFSFGDIGLDDDVKLYIQENIFQRYSVKEVIMWEKIWNPVKGLQDPPQIETGLTDLQKIQNGYKPSKSFRTLFDTTGGLNFKLIYTIPRDKRTSIAFTVVLEKK